MKRITPVLFAAALLLSACAPASVTVSAPASVTVSAPATTAPATTAAPTTAAPTTAAPTTAAPPTTIPVTEPKDVGIRLSQEERESLEQLVLSYGGSVFVGYADLETGESFFYRGDEAMYPASIVKAPFALYVFTLCDEGVMSLDEELTLEASQVREGTGEIKKMPVGTVFTVRELIGYMLTVSDNTAFKMLRDRAGLSGYNRFCRKTLGISNTTYELMSASDCVKALKAIYDYMFPDGYSSSVGAPDASVPDEELTNAELFRRKMGAAGYRLIKASGCEVLHKHGWGNPAYHDTAIVLSKRPYALAILTDHTDGTKEDVQMMADISKAIKSAVFAD